MAKSIINTLANHKKRGPSNEAMRLQNEQKELVPPALHGGTSESQVTICHENCKTTNWLKKFGYAKDKNNKSQEINK